MKFAWNLFATLSAVFLQWSHSTIVNYQRLGATPLVNSVEVVAKNGDILNQALNSLQPGDTFVVPNTTYHLLGGIYARGLKNVTIQIDGTLSFANDRETWPKNGNGDVMECIQLDDIEDVIFTSTGKGTLDGNGQKWWGAIQFLKHQVSCLCSPFKSRDQME